MELNKKQEDALNSGKNMGGMPNGNSFAAVKGVNLRWTNAVIPYVIDCSLGNNWNHYNYVQLYLTKVYKEEIISITSFP